jgi:general stress protein YciG
MLTLSRASIGRKGGKTTGATKRARRDCLLQADIGAGGERTAYKAVTATQARPGTAGTRAAA